jgi:hypothetical protein
MIKEPRRAKRSKQWINERNILPLSTKEIKKIQNKMYRDRKKREKQPINLINNYKEDLNNYLNEQDFTHTGCVNYNHNISLDKAYRNAQYIFNTLLLRGYITNYYFINEYQQQHNHTHYLLTISKETKDIKGNMFRLLNCNYDTCYNWIEPITCKEYKVNAINYFVTKLEPNFNNFKNQKQIDYWFFDQKNRT